MEQDPRLEALAETRARIAEMERLLEELPAIFESKFNERLQPLLEQQQRLLADNAQLHQQLLMLRGSGSTPADGAGDQRPGQPRLLPFTRRRLRALANNALSEGDGGRPIAASADPTHR
ncbi:MAG: hypothetical protein FJ051_02415 [Cyanobacteria bacterium M_surface_9_m1_291]|nr:hypothetical protein [Cyanobacteria bacterium M_surface_9_m1_291]